MARYSTSGRALATAASTNFLSIRSNATRAKIAEIAVFAEAATALNLALYLTTAVDTSGTALTVVKDDPGDVTNLVSVVTGPSGGTLAGSASRRAMIPGSIGAGYVFTFPNALIVPTGLSLVLRNDIATAGPSVTYYINWEE